MCSEYYEQYWKYSYITSVIQTVFNTFLSMLDTRFHGMIKVARLLPIVAIKLFQFQFYQLNSKVIGNSGQKEKLTELLGDCSSVYIFPHFYHFRRSSPAWRIWWHQWDHWWTQVREIFSGTLSILNLEGVAMRKDWLLLRCFWKEEVNKQRDWLMKQPEYRYQFNSNWSFEEIR